MHLMMLLVILMEAQLYFEHEKGTDEALANGVNAITSNIESGDFDITAQRSRQGQQTGGATFRGDGEFINEN